MKDKDKERYLSPEDADCTDVTGKKNSSPDQGKGGNSWSALNGGLTTEVVLVS